MARFTSSLVGRTGFWGLAFTAYRLWRRVPPRHRRQIIRQVRKQSPRVARRVVKGAKKLR